MRIRRGAIPASSPKYSIAWRGQRASHRIGRTWKGTCTSCRTTRVAPCWRRWGSARQRRGRRGNGSWNSPQSANVALCRERWSSRKARMRALRSPLATGRGRAAARCTFAAKTARCRALRSQATTCPVYRSSRPTAEASSGASSRCRLSRWEATPSPSTTGPSRRAGSLSRRAAATFRARCAKAGGALASPPTCMRCVVEETRASAISRHWVRPARSRHGPAGPSSRSIRCMRFSPRSAIGRVRINRRTGALSIQSTLTSNACPTSRRRRRRGACWLRTRKPLRILRRDRASTTRASGA